VRRCSVINGHSCHVFNSGSTGVTVDDSVRSHAAARRRAAALCDCVTCTDRVGVTLVRTVRRVNAFVTL
jgi:hypothetical protein